MFGSKRDIQLKLRLSSKISFGLMYLSSKSKTKEPSRNNDKKIMTIYIQIHAIYNIDKLTLITHFLKVCTNTIKKG